MAKDKQTCIAKILTAHGVRGLVKLRCFLEDPDTLESFNPLLSADGKPFVIKRKNSLKGDDWVAEVNNITDRNDAEKLRNIELFAELKETEDENTFYYDDLVGMEARNAKGEKLGTIQEVDNFGAGDVIKIQPVSGSSYYLPMTEPYVQTIDIENGFVIIEPHEDFMS